MTVISSAPAVKAAMLARFQADALIGGAGVLVTRGHPYPIRPGQEIVSIGASRAQSRIGDRFAGGQSPRALGRDAREERYTVPLTVSVVRHESDDYAAMEDRAYAIADALDASLRAWRYTTPSAFDGLCRYAIVVSVEDGEALEQGKGREALVLIDVNVAAPIEPST